MRTLALTLLAAASLGLAGCAGDDSVTPTDVDTDTDTDGDTEPAPDPVLAGTVSDSAGAPVAGAIIFLCNFEICYQQFSGDDGSYGFIRGDGDYAFKIQAQGYPTASTPLTTVEDGTTRTLDVTLPAYDMTMAMPTSSAEYELASDFYVTFGASDIEIPDTSDASTAGGVFVAEADRMPIDEAPSDGELVGLWYLAAYDSKAKGQALPFRIADAASLGLADDDVVEVYVHSYKEYTTDEDATTQWVSAGSSTVAGGQVNGELPYLATVAVYKQ